MDVKSKTSLEGRGTGRKMNLSDLKTLLYEGKLVTSMRQSTRITYPLEGEWHRKFPQFYDTIVGMSQNCQVQRKEMLLPKCLEAFNPSEH